MKLPDLLTFVGAALIVGGLAKFSISLSMVVAGVMLIVFAHGLVEERP